MQENLSTYHFNLQQQQNLSLAKISDTTHILPESVMILR